MVKDCFQSQSVTLLHLPILKAETPTVMESPVARDRGTDADKCVVIFVLAVVAAYGF
ncbi:hypothetical protein Q669_30680 [Labrenzia sp. C1B10]|nr:hypothetical protein Q669_30680 [Labrenzia sp. C1B10]ERS02912.1 hypothetical protein Q675_31700 [Labrenzia sp. C1B70]